MLQKSRTKKITCILAIIPKDCISPKIRQRHVVDREQYYESLSQIVDLSVMERTCAGPNLFLASLMTCTGRIPQNSALLEYPYNTSFMAGTKS